MSDKNVSDTPIEEQNIDKPVDQIVEEGAPSTEGDESVPSEESKPAAPAKGDEEKPKETPPTKKPKKKVEKVAAPPLTKEEKHLKECERLAKEYSKSYPKEGEFHITSDYQVFLGDNKNAAQNHQRSLKRGGEVVTIKVK